MTPPEARGHCHLCNHAQDSASLHQHMIDCFQQYAAIPSGEDLAPFILLRIDDAEHRQHYLYVAARHDASLGNIDEFLRAAWLDCCQHESRFFFDDFEVTNPQGDDAAHFTIIDWDSPISASALPGASFAYHYDYHDPTILAITSLGIAIMDLPQPVYLAARNLPPRCHTCPATATRWLTTEDELSEAHHVPTCNNCSTPPKPDDVPVVNSPRENNATCFQPSNIVAPVTLPPLGTPAL